MGGAECFSKSTRVAGDHGKAEEARGARRGDSGLWRGEVDLKARQGKARTWRETWERERRLSEAWRC